jgi:glycosyltransferase involved in cell wall biosynthesis
MNPLVSIITVSLNSEETIGDTLESVASQITPFTVEHICVDGGSSDGTRAIIEQWIKQNPSLVKIFEPDRGLFDAMNKGLQLARGHYVLFLNSDDFLAGLHSVADALAHVVTQDVVPDMVMGDVVMGYPDHLGVWRMRRVPRWLPKLPHLGAHPPHQGNFISRELLLRAGGFDAGQYLAADTTQYYRLVHEFSPSMQLSRSVVSFMRMGGASNHGFTSFLRGNIETYRFLRKYHSPATSSLAILVKMTQKLFEYRFSRLRKENFFLSSKSTKFNLIR